MNIPWEKLNGFSVVLLALFVSMCAAVVFNTLFEVVGKIFTARHDAIKAEAVARKAATDLEHAKLEEGMLPVQICSSAGHTCGAPWHDVREDGDGKGNKRRGPNDQGVGSRL